MVATKYILEKAVYILFGSVWCFMAHQHSIYYIVQHKTENISSASHLHGLENIRYGINTPIPARITEITQFQLFDPISRLVRSCKGNTVTPILLHKRCPGTTRGYVT